MRKWWLLFRHLETHGYVTILKNSKGEESILLIPELLVNLVSSIVSQADKHPKELGELSESPANSRKILIPPNLKLFHQLNSSYWSIPQLVRFIGHNICFRETLGSDTLLIFPALIKPKKDLLLMKLKPFDDISYIIRGQVENVYPALVVLLGNTRTFTRVDQWQNQAPIWNGVKEKFVVFRLIEEREGEIELVVYYSKEMPVIWKKNVSKGY